MTTAQSGRTGTSTLDSISLALATRGLRLLRGWPRDEQHLLLEAAGPQGTVAGQWFGSSARAAEVASKTAGAEQVGSVVLQPNGADRKLPFLSRHLGLPGAVLVAHRPERRAVVRLTRGSETGGSAVFVKLVRRDKVAGLARTARMAAALPARTPEVLTVNEAEGSFTTAALPGVPLHDLLEGNGSTKACRAAGAALARLHRAPPPSGLTLHGPLEERRIAARWKHLADSHRLPLTMLGCAAERAKVSQSEVPADELTLIHRDFHDKQILIGPEGNAGVLDFDLMAIGDPMLDLANLLVHLELRSVQGVMANALELQWAVLDGYLPTSQQLRRVPYYKQTTWDRLAAVYAFRCLIVPT